MSHDRVSINIGDHDIWEQRRARLRALESVNGSRCEEEFKHLAPVHAAAKKGDVDEFIQALEKYSAEENASLSDIINTKGPSGNSLLHIAAGIKNADILRALLEVDDEQLTELVNVSGDTALHVATRAGRIHMAERLLNRGSDMNKENNAGNRALHEAVKNGPYELTDLLLDQSPISVNKKNKEGKSPLYLAVEREDLRILLRLLQAVDENEVFSSGIEGMSLVHGAVMHRRLDMLKKMSERKKELFDSRDIEDNTPLHLAAYENYVEGVEFLVDKFSSSAFKHNKNGDLPIHVACKMGHLETIEELIKHWPNPEELLTFGDQQNILHVAAKCGRASIVKYILCNPKLKKLINAKDEKGNTPLHEATKKWQSEVLFSLTRDKRVGLDVVNHDNLTALDIVEENVEEIDAPLHQRLTQTVLVTAGAPRSKDKAICQPKKSSKEGNLKPPNLERLKNVAEIRMLVATLVAAMTFAAGFSVPGGYNGSEPNVGMATLLSKPMYGVFVTCNSIALYCSIIAVVILLWTQINDLNAMHHVLRKARLPLLVALATMSMAFMAGVYVTVSKQTWLAIVTLVIGITALIVILGLYIALFVPLAYNARFVQFFADYIIKAGISISRSVTEGRDITQKPMVTPAQARASPLQMLRAVGPVGESEVTVRNLLEARVDEDEARVNEDDEDVASVDEDEARVDEDHDDEAP